MKLPVLEGTGGCPSFESEACDAVKSKSTNMEG